MDAVLALDIQILHGISHMQCIFLDTVMPIVTALGNYGAFWIACGLLFLFSSKHRKNGLILLLTLLAGVIIGQGVIKPLVGRIRPFAEFGMTELLIPLPSDFSFPSGHTLASVSAAVIIWHINRKWGIAAWCLAALIIFSRMYLWVHYPSDVLAGALIGAVLSFTAIQIDTYWRKKTNQNCRKAD